ncbi:MAG: GNAT family N-acetyltransferase [Actinomycetota bacterium]|nr:GNAT family N-acetyltransferase [Actinomycetota bacterium]
MTEIRTLSPDDWPVWRGLRLAALAEAPEAFGSRLADWLGEGDREGRWRDRLSIPGSYNIVAMLDDQAVGMASGLPTADDGVVELISMWVAPTAHGRGVGDALPCEVEWPTAEGAQQMMMHLDFEVVDLEAAVAHALELGAELAEYQPQDDVRVVLDPAGHPFCLYT